MSDIYLHTIGIEDFRTFGDFQVEIPPGPGLTLLVGANGLGKSSFFDALEWGLTGRVRRLQRYVPSADEADYLTRRGAQGPHGVTLGFSGAAELRRKGAIAPATAAVIALLKRPTWGAQIQDIGTYLAFTHFLGQAEPQRFTSRDRDDQWAALKGPSGIERLEEVRRGLRGRTTQLAFTRRIKKDADAVAELTRQRDEWQAFRARLTRLRDAAGAAGGLDRRRLESRLAALDDQIPLVASADARRPPSGETTAAGLARLRRRLEAVRADVSDRRRLLAGLSDLPARYAAATAASLASAAPLQDGLDQLVRDRMAVEAAEAAAVTARANLTAAVADAERLRLELAALEAIRLDLDAVATADRETTELAAQQEATEAALARARNDLATVEAELAAGRVRAEALARRSATANAASELLGLARGISDLADRARRSAETASERDAAAVLARSNLQQFSEARGRIEAEREAAQAALAAARSRATAMAAAVAQIAGHLHDDDTDCPVCRSHFPIGALRQLAQESAGAQSAELAQAEANETRLASALAENAGSVAQAEAAIASAAEARRTAEADGAALRQREARVRAGLAEGATGLLAGALEAEARADADFAEASAAAATDAADIAQATLRRETLPSDIADLERQLEALAVAAASREADHRTRQERIAAAGPAATKAEDLTAQLAALQARLGEAEAVQRESQAAADGAGAALETARSRFDSSTQSAAGLEAARAAAADTVAALEARWRDAGLDGVPAAGTLETALAAVSQRAADVERLEDERAELVSASSLADRDEELKILVSEMEAVGGKGAADDPEPRDAALATALAAAEDVHRQSRDAQTAVRALSEKLRDEAESFSTRFLEPLNHLIEGFNEALLSTPGDSVRFQADNRVDTTHFEMGLQYRDPLEDALFNKELPPQVVLSEGQLAANGFSILCAASTAYPWSRWRSLLLDDPLQHNDIIHAAAFVDLMRNLVEMERYQLLMSSHDRGEAEFIARKFEAAGLPCKVIALTAPSRAGVRYEEPQPNSAAQTLLQESRAMSA